jgi:uncharacterized protein YbjT (DUF2867 family)
MILVTGANGQVGSAVIRQFSRRQSLVRALVRSSKNAQAVTALPGVDIVEGDMRRPETLGAALVGIDRVLLISSSNDQMVETQSTFVDAAKKAGVRHIVKLSGLNASLTSPFIFNRMHAEAERYIERSALAWTHLRPSQFMTEYLREVPTIVAHNALFLPLENAKLAPVDIEDVARAAYMLLRGSGHEGKRYEMTGPQALSMTEVADQISSAIGKTVRYVNIDPAARKQALLEAGIPAYIVDALDVQASERRKGATGEDIVHTETHAALDLQPTSFAEFTRRSAAAFNGQ